MQIIYFQFKECYISFMTLQNIGFRFFAKIMTGNCVFCCSSCISFNLTCHPKPPVIQWLYYCNPLDHTSTTTFQRKTTASQSVAVSAAKKLYLDLLKQLNLKRKIATDDRKRYKTIKSFRDINICMPTMQCWDDTWTRFSQKDTALKVS